MVVPSFLINQVEIAKGVKKVQKMFKSDVVRIFHNIGDNWMGDPVLYFRVLISDEAADKIAKAFEKRVYGRELTKAIEEAMDREVDPLGRWGLFPHFDYRSVSEQAYLNDKDWV